MPSPFSLSIQQLEGRRVIQFANQSSQFVEVVFIIDGKEVKEGKVPTSATRGYGYPPKLEKPVRMMRNGQDLPFGSSGGTVEARIFIGDGEYHDADLNKPTFLRHTLVDKVRFKRTSAEPTEVMVVQY